MRTRALYRSLTLLLLACVMIFTRAAPAWADEREYKIEAAFLYNFFNYITWPEYYGQDMKNPVICIDGADPIRPYLEYIARTRTQERALSIRPAGDTLEGCQILFIRHITDAALQPLRQAAAAKGVLLVSTAPDFIENGGMVGLTKEGERIAIEINNTALKEANFQVSSRLLSLAGKVD